MNLLVIQYICIGLISSKYTNFTCFPVYAYDFSIVTLNMRILHVSIFCTWLFNSLQYTQTLHAFPILHMTFKSSPYNIGTFNLFFYPFFFLYIKLVWHKLKWRRKQYYLLSHYISIVSLSPKSYITFTIFVSYKKIRHQYMQWHR